MSLAIGERADLLDPGRRLAQHVLRDAYRGRIQRFTTLSAFPWQ
jgi:hypothetical protein